MPYKVKAWIPCGEGDVEVIYFKGVAEDEADHCRAIQPENIYRVVECDELGEDAD